MSMQLSYSRIKDSAGAISVKAFNHVISFSSDDFYFALTYKSILSFGYNFLKAKKDNFEIKKMIIGFAESEVVNGWNFANNPHAKAFQVKYTENVNAVKKDSIVVLKHIPETTEMSFNDDDDSAKILKIGLTEIQLFISEFDLINILLYVMQNTDIVKDDCRLDFIKQCKEYV